MTLPSPSTPRSNKTGIPPDKTGSTGQTGSSTEPSSPTWMTASRQDPRIFPVVAAFFLGPVGLWWWSRQQPQKPGLSVLFNLFLLWGFQLVLAWSLLPPLGRLQQPGWYALLFANLLAIGWLLGVILAPPAAQSLTPSYWCGYALHLFLFEMWLIVLHPLTQYTPFPVQSPVIFIGGPVLLGLGWVLSLRQTLASPRQPSLLPNPRMARVLGWLLSLLMGIILLMFVYLIQHILKRV